MAARKPRRRSTARGRQLLEQLTTEARALQSACEMMESLTSHRAVLLANLLADLSTECRRGIDVMRIAAAATTIEQARQVLYKYLTSIDR
jgi:hypothetical protein